jgi:hypothetical protein
LENLEAAKELLVKSFEQGVTLPAAWLKKLTPSTVLYPGMTSHTANEVAFAKTMSQGTTSVVPKSFLCFVIPSGLLAPRDLLFLLGKYLIKVRH